MTWKTRFLGVALGAMSGALMAQQATSAQSTTTTTTTTQSVTGSVVQYSPGQTIVVRSADGKTTTYTLGPSVSVPADVQIGRSVTLSTQPGANGAQSVVTRIEVKNANPADSSAPAGSSAPSAWSGSPSGAAGQFSSSTTTSTSAMTSPSGASSPSATSAQDASAGRPSSGAPTASGQSSAIPPSSGLSSGTSQSDQSETTQTTTTISGKVTAYQPKQFITLDEPGKGTVTYVIDAQSTLPQDIAVGKTVTVTTRTVEGSSKPVVRTVTTTTRTTKTTESHPQ